MGSAFLSVGAPWLRSPGEEPEHALEASDVADAVALAISSRAEAVIDEIRLSPLKHVLKRKSGSD